MRRQIALNLSFAMLAVTPGLLAPPLCAEEKPVVVKVMTRNLDAGTDLNLIFAAADQSSLAQAIAATLAEVKESGMPERAARVADEIAVQQPDLIGLQEVTLWRTGPLSLEPTGARNVLCDQLDLLLAELGKRKLAYTVIAQQTLADVEAPDPIDNLNVRLTDRDVILARADLKQSDLYILGVQTHTYEHLLPLPFLGGLTIPRAWESADVRIRGKRFRFINTHLETTDPRVPETVLLQLVQTRELLATVKDTDVPVVLLGDFNANAEAGLEHTGSVEMILAGGFKDVWATLYPGNPGYTWPLFGEDQSRGMLILPNERIDLIFTRGLTPRSMQRLGLGGFWGPLASDHVGLVASLEIEK